MKEAGGLDRSVPSEGDIDAMTLLLRWVAAHENAALDDRDPGMKLVSLSPCRDYNMFLTL